MIIKDFTGFCITHKHPKQNKTVVKIKTTDIKTIGNNIILIITH